MTVVQSELSVSTPLYRRSLSSEFVRLSVNYTASGPDIRSR